jgi:hypothetical protein
MSTADARAPIPEFLDIDSFDVDLDRQYDNDPDPFEDSFISDWNFPSEPSHTYPIPSSRPKTVPSSAQRRHGYGMGVDARRSARYRAYPVQSSTIHRRLCDVYGIVTKEMLQALITAVIDRSPVTARPLAPTRSQRRVKGGLMAWLDDHESVALSCLDAQGGLA